MLIVTTDDVPGHRCLEAEAIVAVRFTTSTVADGAAELYGYGTAVRLEPARHRTNTAKL